MSIIAEALKKAKKERDKTITSKEYLNKILGPERKETYRREKFKAEKLQFQPKVLPSGDENMESPNIPYIRNKTVITLATLLLVVIVFSVITNIFRTPSPGVGAARHKEAPGVTGVQLEAEAYTNPKSEIALPKNKGDLIDKMTRVFKSDLTRNEFLSNFTLNGVVYDANDSWAIINNKLVRVGDSLDGAKVISITPQKVVLFFKNKEFDLAVKY